MCYKLCWCNFLFVSSRPTVRQTEIWMCQNVVHNKKQVCLEQQQVAEYHKYRSVYFTISGIKCFWLCGVFVNLINLQNSNTTFYVTKKGLNLLFLTSSFTNTLLSHISSLLAQIGNWFAFLTSASHFHLQFVNMKQNLDFLCCKRKTNNILLEVL